MSNVYLRNRKPSSYEKYIAIKYIDTELTEMYKSKNEKYFPKGHKRIYIEMHNNNLKAIQIGAVIYNERSRHSGDIDSIAKCINLVNELIHYSEENLQLLQYHMKNLNLDDRDIPATKKKIANRFIRVIENYILYQKSMKSYYKTLIKKKKNLMKKQNDKNLY